MSLSSEEIERYARQIVLRGVGGPGQNKLKAARALVVGAGGLGSPALQYLAGAGVGALGIVDDDLVALSNLHRQILHGTGDVGRPKTESAAAAIARLNPHVAVEPIAVRLDACERPRNCRALRCRPRRLRQFHDPLRAVRRLLLRAPPARLGRARRIRRHADDAETLRDWPGRQRPTRPIAASSPTRRSRERSRPAPRPACSGRSPAFSAR